MSKIKSLCVRRKMRMKGDKKWKKSNQLNRTNECFCSILTQLQYLMTRRHCCWMAACFRSFFLMLITVVQVLIYTLIFLECEGNGLMTPPPQNPYANRDWWDLEGKKKCWMIHIDSCPQLCCPLSKLAVVGWPGLAARCPSSCSFTPLLKRTWGENKMENLVDQDKDREIA